ncbi:MAG: Gx transporter family protein [bacterium]
MKQDKQIKTIAFLTACASILQIGESLLPHPIPGIRFGLANIITLIALVRLGFRPALEIAVLRTLVSSFVLGSFLSPAFALSFSGALTGALIMGAVYKLATFTDKCSFSLIGISLWGALANNSIQIVLVYFLFIKHPGVFVFLPWLGMSAVITGWITGLVAVHVCKRLEQPAPRVSAQSNIEIEAPGFISSGYINLNSPVHRAAPEIKICAAAGTAVLMVWFDSFFEFSAVFLVVLSLIYISRVPFSDIFNRLKKLSFFLGSSFLIPFFFVTQGNLLLHTGPVHITQEGIIMGFLCTARLTCMMVCASLLIMTTSPESLTSGVEKLLTPLKLFGISNKRIAVILMLSMQSLPELWKMIYVNIQNLSPEEKRLKKLVPTTGGLIAAVYRRID